MTETQETTSTAQAGGWTMDIAADARSATVGYFCIDCGLLARARGEVLYDFEPSDLDPTDVCCACACVLVFS